MAKFEHRVGEMLAAASPLAVELRGLTSTLTSLRWWNENRYPAGAKAPATVAGLRTAVNRCIIAAELCTTDSAFAGLVEAPPPVPRRPRFLAKCQARLQRLEADLVAARGLVAAARSEGFPG